MNQSLLSDNVSANFGVESTIITSFAPVPVSHATVIKIHVSCMVVAWALLIPLANYVARHYRAVFTTTGSCHTKSWAKVRYTTIAHE